MQIPMWIMYVIIFIGLAGGALRSLQMCVIHIKNFNVPPVNSVEAAAADELAAADIEASEIAEVIASNDGMEEAIVDDALTTAWTDNGRGEA